MNPKQLKNVARRLLALQEELLSEKDNAAEGAAPVELDQARMGRLSRMGDLQQQAMALEQNRRRDLQLKRIEGAFLRIEAGAYGRCAGCGVDIDEKRLAFDPTVFFCVECAERAERR